MYLCFFLDICMYYQYRFMPVYWFINMHLSYQRVLVCMMRRSKLYDITVNNRKYRIMGKPDNDFRLLLEMFGAWRRDEIFSISYRLQWTTLFRNWAFVCKESVTVQVGSPTLVHDHQTFRIMTWKCITLPFCPTTAMHLASASSGRSGQFCELDPGSRHP